MFMEWSFQGVGNDLLCRRTMKQRRCSDSTSFCQCYSGWAYLTGTTDLAGKLSMPPAREPSFSDAQANLASSSLWTSDMLMRQWAGGARYLRKAVEAVAMIALAKNVADEMQKVYGSSDSWFWSAARPGRLDWECVHEKTAPV